MILSDKTFPTTFLPIDFFCQQLSSIAYGIQLSQAEYHHLDMVSRKILENLKTGNWERNSESNMPDNS